MYPKENLDPLSLGRGATLRINGGRGTLVYVWEGEVWLTQDGSTADHVLSAGQWFRVEGKRAYAQAFSNSVLSVSAARTEPRLRFPSSLRRWWSEVLSPAQLG
jgi:hypothetical protein